MTLTASDIHRLIEAWAARLGVQVERIQIRTMRHKWGSVSTVGNLTLSSDILTLPCDLAEYIIVHELMHLKFPNHHRGWQVSMGMYLSDWREREQRLKQLQAEEETLAAGSKPDGQQ
ncbi:MAG: M48 family metallopeptidase [Caldilineaceae bacterium]|nr:M48 family metallopeptidase [Caldilineaceae bacterium]